VPELIVVGEVIAPCDGVCAIDCVQPARPIMLIAPAHTRICFFIARSFRGCVSCSPLCVLITQVS
jgi:hypothetical protein